MSDIDDSHSKHDANLPDPARLTGKFNPFSCDPGWNESWWWLGIPALLALSLIVINAAWSDFYATWILPEGYGFLELGHFFIPLAAMLIALRLLFLPYVRERKLLFVFLCLVSVACLYIAGEEHSWGQHFFHWQTPEYWSQLNRQQETNLHNTTHYFGKKPRWLLEIGILIGGLILPLLAVFTPVIRANRWALFIPAASMVPTAFGALLFKMVSSLHKGLGVAPLVMRPSEATESYLYLFLLFYMILFARRIGELERE